MCFVDQFRETGAYDYRAEQAVREIDFNNEEAIRSQLPQYLEDLDAHRRDAKFYPSLMIFLDERGCGQAQLGTVVEVVYPNADLKKVSEKK